jgi:hypothetical protein
MALRKTNATGQLRPLSERLSPADLRRRAVRMMTRVASGPTERHAPIDFAPQRWAVPQRMGGMIRWRRVR